MSDARITRSEFLRWMGAAGLALGAPGCSRLPIPGLPGRRRPPNFVVILIDDLGAHDLGYAGSRFYETPNLDRLASQGMVFSDAYAAAPLCSPTRASILTGKSPARLHLTVAITYDKQGKIQESGRAEDKRKGPAWEKLVSPGHLGYLPLEEVTIAEELHRAGYINASIGKWHLGTDEFKPELQGFDLNFGGTQQPSPPSYFYPYKIKNITSGVEGEYITDRLETEAEKFIEDNQDRPFLLYFPHYGVHGPWQAKEEMIRHYEGKVEPNAPQRNPVYAAMIQSVDEAVGRLMATLDRLHLADDTLVLFLSDNGGLLRRLNADKNSGEEITSNAPLRGGKAMLQEGGIRVPMIARWPGKIAAGSVCDTPVISTDLYPTLLEFAGLEPSPGRILDGVSLVPLLTRSEPPDRDALFFHFAHYIGGYRPDPAIPTYWNRPCSAVRMGDWKLIELHEGGVELYNLREDIGETGNLADREWQRAAEMRKRLNDWLQEVGAWMPLPNPAYDPSVTTIPKPKPKNPAASQPASGPVGQRRQPRAGRTAASPPASRPAPQGRNRQRPSARPPRR